MTYETILYTQVRSSSQFEFTGFHHLQQVEREFVVQTGNITIFSLLPTRMTRPLLARMDLYLLHLTLIKHKI